MTMPAESEESQEQEKTKFREAVRGFLRGDFSALEPLFFARDGGRPKILDWYDRGWFRAEPAALAEALSCACFNGKTEVAESLMRSGVDPAAGAGTGMDAFHWAANRGQLDTVRLLIAKKVPLETRNTHGTTVLGTAVWSAIHEPKPHHLAIIEALLAAGGRRDVVGYPTGDVAVDALLRRPGAP